MCKINQRQNYKILSSSCKLSRMFRFYRCVDSRADIWLELWWHWRCVSFHSQKAPLFLRVSQILSAASTLIARAKISTATKTSASLTWLTSRSPWVLAKPSPIAARMSTAAPRQNNVIRESPWCPSGNVLRKLRTQTVRKASFATMTPGVTRSWCRSSVQMSFRVPKQASLPKWETASTGTQFPSATGADLGSTGTWPTFRLPSEHQFLQSLLQKISFSIEKFKPRSIHSFSLLFNF